MLLLLLFSCALSILIFFIRSNTTTLSHNNKISSTGTTTIRTTNTPQVSHQQQQLQQPTTAAATAVKGFFNSIWTSIKSAVLGDDANDSGNTSQTTVQSVRVVPSSSTSSLIYQSLSNIFVHVPKLEPANCYITSLGNERKQLANNVSGNTTRNHTSGQQQQQVYYVNKVGPQEFLLHLMDDRSSPFGCLEDQIVHESDIHVSVTGGSFESLSLIETDDTLAANIRRVKFSIPISGWYNIHVKVMNCSIRNSPFRLYLEPDVVDPSKVTITGPMINSIDGTILQKKLDAFIKLILYDKYGNKVKATSALRDSISVLFNDNPDPNNPDFTARIVVNHPEENYIIRITPQKTGIHRMQVFYEVTNLVSKKSVSSDATHIQLFVLGKEGYKIFKSLDNNSQKLSFPVTLTKVKKDRVKKKDVYMIIANDTLQIVSYVLYFIPRVIVEFAVKHLEYEVDTSNQSSFTICEASYKRRSCTATQVPNASKIPKTLRKYQLSCPKRTLVIAILKALRTRPMKEIDMKLTLSHLFTNFDEYSEREVSQVYDVFAANEQSHQAFMDFFGTFLRMQGTQILSSLESSTSNNTVTMDQMCKQLVDDLLYFYHKMLTMIDKYFAASEMLKSVLNKTFSEMIHSDISSTKNSKESSVSLFCSYCDHLMRTGQSDDQLDRIVTLFKLVQDKDVLQEMYRRQLALRLIARGTEDQSLYDERAMLVKLKMSFGLGFTCRMEGMARDIQANCSLLESFASHLAHKGYRTTTPSTVDSKYQIQRNGITFKPLILTQGYWPSFSSQEIKPATSGAGFVRPREMDECIHEFTQFYRNHTHGGRTLTWLMSSGTVAITALFWSGEYELVLPTYLACILLQFNRNGHTASEPELSMKHIGESLNVPPGKIANFIKRLASPKLKLIKLKTATKTPATIDSLFVINGDFESNLKKIRVSESEVGPSVEKQVEQVVVRDRTFAIEAALVRIMKTRKTMSHKLLLMECSKQLLPFFNPDVKMIKQRIDSLIEREFLSRDDEDITTLHYVA